MVVLLGKTASGKTFVKSELLKNGFKDIITYTTRPMRKDEEQDITYHYITEDDFKNRIQDGFFAEWRSYTTVRGVWYYGTALEDLQKAEDNSVIILSPDGYRSLLKKMSKPPISIYIYTNNTTIKKRLAERNDKSESERRLLLDNSDFRGLENDVDGIVYNNEDGNIKDVIEKILDIIKRKKK